MIDLKGMLKAGIHFGHKTSRWSPAMSPYIWGARNKIHLIDVSKTAFLLERSGKYLKDLAANGGTFLWVGTKKPAQKAIQKIATELKMPYVVHRWVGGTLSNHEQIKKAITKLLHLKDVVSKPNKQYKKKEISMIQKEIARLERNIGGILDLAYPPAALILVDAKKEHSAIHEALNLKIPTVAIVDTNTDPEGINFVIPANDDSPRSIEFVLEYLASNISEGQKEFASKKTQSKIETSKKTKVEAKPTKEVAKKTVTKTEVKKAVTAKPVDTKTTPEKSITKKPEVKKAISKTPESKADTKITESKAVTKTTATTTKKVVSKDKK